MKNWKKINTKEMTQIKGGTFWISVWALSLTSVFVARSLFSDKASLSMNGVGKATWENNESKNKKIVTSENHNYNDHLEKFISKFYAV